MPLATDIFKGSFIASPEELAKKLQHIKAYIFDWDGVFNDAHKSLDQTSSYSETDSMGINLLRFAHYLKQGHSAPVAVITGEQNKVAFGFAQREHFVDHAAPEVGIFVQQRIAHDVQICIPGQAKA